MIKIMRLSLRQPFTNKQGTCLCAGHFLTVDFNCRDIFPTLPPVMLKCLVSCKVGIRVAPRGPGSENSYPICSATVRMNSGVIQVISVCFMFQYMKIIFYTLQVSSPGQVSFSNQFPFCMVQR